MSKRGGKRAGAGRHPAPPGTKKVHYATKLKPILVQYLRQCTNAAKTIEESLESSHDYREWLSHQDQN